MNHDPIRIFVTSENHPNYKTKRSSNGISEIPRNSISIPIDLFSSTRVQTEGGAVQFLKIFFNFSYYLLFVPFRFSFNSENGTYEVHRNAFQKFLLVSNNVATGTFFFFKLLKKLESASEPTEYLEISYYFCDTLYIIFLMHFFRRKASEMQAILRELQQNENDEQQDASLLSSNGQEHKHRAGYWRTRLVPTVISALCVFPAMCATMDAFYEANWSISKIYLGYELDGMSVFSRFNLNTISREGSIFTSASAIFAFLSFWSTMTERTINMFSDILFVMLTLTFHCIVQAFLQLLKRDSIEAESVIKSYRKLRNMTERLNSTMSLIIGSFIVGNLPFFVTNVFDIFSDKENAFLKIRYSFYCCYYFPSLFLAAKSCAEMEHKMKVWVTEAEQVRRLSFLDLSLLIQQVNHQPVALGSFDCLYVNFSLVGSEISIILTYALLKSQFHLNAQERSLQSM